MTSIAGPVVTCSVCGGPAPFAKSGVCRSCNSTFQNQRRRGQASGPQAAPGRPQGNANPAEGAHVHHWMLPDPSKENMGKPSVCGCGAEAVFENSMGEGWHKFTLLHDMADLQRSIQGRRT